MNKKTKAELLSEIVSRHRKDEGCKQKSNRNPKKIGNDAKHEVRSSNNDVYRGDFKNVDPSRVYSPPPSFYKQNDTTQGSMRSNYSQSTLPKHDNEYKDELRDSQLEVNSIYEKRSNLSMPTKMGENNESGYSQYFSNMNYMMDHHNYSQGNFSVKLDTDRRQDNQNRFPPYMMHPMSVHSQMIANPYGAPYPMGMYPQQ